MKEYWIFPCNPKYFDIEKHFQENDIVCFKRKGSPKNGDVVYIYISGTLKQLKYKCEIIDEDVKGTLLLEHKYVIKDDPYAYTKPHYTAMKLLEIIDDGLFTLTWLRKHGTNQFIAPARISRKTIESIKSIEKTKNSKPS